MYRLELSNNQSWNIAAEEPVRAWAERLADILQLQKGEIPGCPRLVFRQKGAGTEIELSDFEERAESRETLQLEEVTLRSHPDRREVVCEVPRDAPDLMGIWEAVCAIYSRAQLSGGLPIHSGLIEREGTGVLIAGVSESGKSTCCRRIPPPWYSLCDEEVLVLPNRDRSAYRAHPFPTWSLFTGPADLFSWDVRRAIPLKAVFFIEKAHTDFVEALGQGGTAMRLFSLADEKCHLKWDRVGRAERVSRREQLFENACGMAGKVPGYILKVARSGRFWKKMEEVLS